jgi:hypothetical protein
MVDDIDYDRVIRLRWSIHPHDATVYARGTIEGHHIYLHRFILGVTRDPTCGSKIVVDHINGKGYDCRRENLRWVTVAENNRNPHPCEWRDVVRIDGGWGYRINIAWKVVGSFRTAFDAVLARDAAIRQLSPEYSYLCQFPPPDAPDYQREFASLP